MRRSGPGQDEFAVQVGPQRDQRQQPARRRSAPFARRNQSFAQATITGNANTCGRAKKCTLESTIAANVTRIA